MLLNPICSQTSDKNDSILRSKFILSYPTFLAALRPTLYLYWYVIEIGNIFDYHNSKYYFLLFRKNFLNDQCNNNIPLCNQHSFDCNELRSIKKNYARIFKCA